MPSEREATPIDVRGDGAGIDYLRAVMAETPTYWSDGLPPPAAAPASAADPAAPLSAAAPAAPHAPHAHPADRPMTVWTPLGARQTSPESSESSWVIPAITIVLVLGIIAIIAAVIW